MSDSQGTISIAAVPLLDLKAQYACIKEEVDAAIQRVVDAQAFVLGPEVEAFEQGIAKFLGVEHAVGVASGTDALLLPLKALELDPDDHVVVPAFTFFATAGAVWNASLRPVFADVNPSTFNVDLESVQAAWTDRTRAVIPVDLFGQMAPLEAVNRWAEKKSATVIEDAAQAIGAWQETDGVRRMAAAASTMGSLSFFPTKNLGAFGDAGLVTTSDADLAEKLRKLRVHGGRQMYHHEVVGTNSRIDALQAAILGVKLRHLDGWAAARAQNAALYNEMFADVADVIPPSTVAGNHHVFNQYTLRVRRRDELREYLSDRGVGSGIYYPVPLHLQACFQGLGYKRGDFPVAEALSEQVISLPVYPELGEARVRHVGETVRSFYGL